MNDEEVSLVTAFTDSRNERWADSDWHVPYRAAILDVVISNKERLRSNIREVLYNHKRSISKYDEFELNEDEMKKISDDLFRERFVDIKDRIVNGFAYQCVKPASEFREEFEYDIPINSTYTENIGISDEDFCSLLAFHFDNYERKLLGE